MKYESKFSTHFFLSLLVFNKCWENSAAAAVPDFETNQIQESSKKSTFNCSIRDFSNVLCVGDFNLSQFLYDRRNNGNFTNIDPNAWDSQLSELKIFNSSTLDIIEGNLFQFHNFTFERILIENVPNLKSIRPTVFLPLKDRLTDFRAIGTSLPNYNSYEVGLNPFEGFTTLNEVYVGEQPSCPKDESLIWPCICKFGPLVRANPSGLYGTSGWGTQSVFGTRAEINCKTDNLTGHDLKTIFDRISASSHSPKYFDVLNLEGSNITSLPASTFSNVSFTAVWMRDMSNLRSIHENAFVFKNGVAASIQILEIDTANFTVANETEVIGFFRAMSSLSNIRSLRLSQIGLPYIPAFAFGQSQRLFNLRYLSISFDLKIHSSGVKSIGSYAFAGAPNLIAVGLIRNFIDRIDSFAFASNESTRMEPLVVEIGGNPINDKEGLKENAFSSGKRALQIKFQIDSFATSDPANTPNFQYFPENVFRSFIEENEENYFEVDYHNVDIWCDCGSNWMFGEDGILKKTVERALRIKRVEDNTVSSEPLSILCKPESSFSCLPNCLVFPISSLVHCGGNEEFDVRNTFEGFAKTLNTSQISNLKFSAKGIKEVFKNSFGGFQFKQVHLSGCKNLTKIHPEAFGDSAKAIQHFTAANTSLTNYPNFGKFPNLERVSLDDHSPYHITNETFDFTNEADASSGPVSNTRGVNIFLDNGNIDESAFTNLKNNTNIVLNIGESRDCDTMGCLFKCKPTQLKIEKKIFKPFLRANPKNQIKTNCYLECSCALKWMHEQWESERLGSQVEIWFTEYFGSKFYCVPPGTKVETEENIFGIDVTKFDYGNYFSKNC